MTITLTAEPPDRRPNGPTAAEDIGHHPDTGAAIEMDARKTSLSTQKPGGQKRQRCRNSCVLLGMGKQAEKCESSQITNPSTLAEANPKKCESSETTLAVDNFLAAIAPARRPTTLRGYAQELKTWARYAEAVRTPELAAAAKDWPDYWAFRCARTSAQSWRALALAHRHFWTWAIETRRAETSPVKTIFLPKRRTSTRLPPNETDFAKLIQPDHPIGTRGLCDHAMITLLAETGARVSEICGMKIADTDIRGKTATVTLKGGKPGTIYMGEGAGRAVTQWLQNGRPKVTRPDSPDNLLLSQRGSAMTSEMQPAE